MIDTLLWLGVSQAELDSKRIRLDGDGRLLQASGTLRLDGAAAAFAMNRHAGETLERVELYGSGRSAAVENLERLTLAEKGKPAVVKQPGSWETVLERRGFTEMIDHVLAGLDDPQTCTIRADQVMATHRLTEKLFRDF